MHRYSMKPRIRRNAIIMLLLLASLGPAACTGASPLPPESPPILGLADFHSHQFAHLGFGQRLHLHDLNGFGACRRIPGYNSDTDQIDELVRGGLFEEAKAQGDGQCYPTWSNFAGQQMDSINLKRAWSYGLRLQVVFAVNSEYLCKVAQLADPYRCDTDKAAIERQLKAAVDLEAQIDEQAGGPGKGWYRIVRTPAEARSVIQQGKLAVVLGIEASNAFGCAFVGTQLECDDAIAQGASTLRPLALFEHYYSLGVRHFFMIHNINGVAGGAALSIPLLHAKDNPSRLLPGKPFNKVDNIDALIRANQPAFNSTSCPMFSFDGGICNAKGLSRVGEYLLKFMADHGAVIDIDHMSLRTKRRALADGQVIAAYPFISSHTGVNYLSHGDKLNEGGLSEDEVDKIIKYGGAFAPILHTEDDPANQDTFPSDATVAANTCGGTSESFVQPYRYLVSRLKVGKQINGRAAFVGIGYGSDFNGLAGWPAPRFWAAGTVKGSTDLAGWLKAGFVGGSATVRPGHCHGTLSDRNPIPHVRYPFNSPLTGKSFDKSVTTWPGALRAYDIGTSGVAHVGMVPDFVEELRTLGLTEAELQPLWHGAEAYIRAWEASTAWQRFYSEEHQAQIRESCSNERGKLASTVDDRSEVGPSVNREATKAKWIAAINELKRLGCDGTR